MSQKHCSSSEKRSCTVSDVNETQIELPSYSAFRRVLLLGEADFSFTKAFAQEQATLIRRGERNEDEMMKIVASEYGSGTEIANRYFDGNHQRLSEHLNSLLQFDSVEEVISGLNARNLGDYNSRRRRGKLACDDSNENDEKEICRCSRWNVNQNRWDEPCPFWRNATKIGGNYKDKYDLIIFNFPHSDQAGRATRLVKAFFKQMRICIDAGKLSNSVVVEMRLRTIEKNPLYKRNIRSFYRHEESAEESGFTCIGCWPGKSDMQRWEKWGYQHKMTKKNETCRDIATDCKVWRWSSL